MNRRKDNGNFITKIWKSFKHGLDGINYAIENEINTLIMMVISIVLFILCFIFNATIIELAVILVTMGMTFLAEMFNSSIEALGDSVTLEDNKLIKIAKDCATSGVIVTVFIELVVAGVIIIPKII